MNSDRLYVHVPAERLPDRLDYLLERGLQPEVACQESSLEKLDFPLLAACAEELRSAGLKVTLHAPYRGFTPGSSKARSRRQSHELATESLQLAQQLQAEKVIFHPGIPGRGSQRELELWLQHSQLFWPEFLDQAQTFACTICLENIYDPSPHWLLALLQELNSPHLGHVFDIGHWNLFGTGELADWLAATADYLVHLHLHDNFGQSDQHLALGRGKAPLSELFQWLAQHKVAPSLTLENHNQAALEESLLILKKEFSGPDQKLS